MEELSIGRSGDFDLAIEEGAILVRAGQAIFGVRSTPERRDWPSGPAATSTPEHTG
jgi:hypothetical protein